MLPFDRDTTPTVTIEHIPHDEIVVASFDWTIAQPQHTYTIDATPNLSLELDRHFPVRLSQIVLTSYVDAESLVMLEKCTGEALTAAMQCAREVDFSVMRLSLTVDNRLAIAKLQQASPSSSPLLKKACNAIIAGLIPETSL